jgi:transposase
MKQPEDLTKALQILLNTKKMEVALAYYATVMDVKISVAKTKALKYKYNMMKMSGLEYIANSKNWSK